MFSGQHGGGREAARVQAEDGERGWAGTAQRESSAWLPWMYTGQSGGQSPDMLLYLNLTNFIFVK